MCSKSLTRTTKCKHGYMKSWGTKYAWLSYDDVLHAVPKVPDDYICGKNAFVVGTDNF